MLNSRRKWTVFLINLVVLRVASYSKKCSPESTKAYIEILNRKTRILIQISYWEESTMALAIYTSIRWGPKLDSKFRSPFQLGGHTLWDLSKQLGNFRIGNSIHFVSPSSTLSQCLPGKMSAGSICWIKTSMMVRVARHRGGASLKLISAPDTPVEGDIANTCLIACLPGHSSHHLAVGARKLFVKVQMGHR